MFHVVQHGEILRRIAEHYGTTVAIFKAANHTIEPDLIRAGQVLAIPESATKRVGPIPRTA
jgi:LysM repeat protein